MPYIAPNSTIYLCRNVPLDSSYEHTYYWPYNASGKEAQHSKLISYVKPDDETYSYVLQKYSYQRVNNNTIKVAIPSDYLQDINYMCFQNSAYSGKWFYAFVNSANYINDHTAEINYTIDTMQTWYFDYELGQSFIERQHSETDGIGDNIVEEGIDTGEYMINKTDHIDLSEQHVLVLSTREYDDHVDAGYAHNGIYSGLIANTIPLSIRSYRYDFNVEWRAVESPFTARLHGLTTTPTDAAYTVTFTPPESEYWSDWAAHPVGAITPTALYATNGARYEAYFEGSYIKVKILQRVGETTFRPVPAFGFNEDWDYDESTGVYRLPIVSTLAQGGDTFSVYLDTSWYTTTNNDGKAIKDYLDEFEDPSAVVNVYQYPAWIDQGKTTLTDNVAKEEKIITLLKNNSIINNKCYTYPYNYLTVSNNVGQSVDYRWEDGTRGTNTRLIRFNMLGTRYGTPTVFLYPKAYRNTPDDYESGLTLNNFPNCSWNSDVYKTWWNQNKNSAMTSMLFGVLSAAVPFVNAGTPGEVSAKGAASISSAGNIAGSILSASNSVASLLAKRADMKAIPPSAQGQYANDGLNNAIGRTGYTFYWVSSKPEIMKIIDSYFQMYGYASKQVKVPNIHARSKYTYVKTQGCIIHGKVRASIDGAGLPADAEKEITAIYNKGITFWVPSNNYEIGDYFNPANHDDATWNAPL